MVGDAHLKIQVSGDSMWPTLRSGDAVLLSTESVARPGSVVVAKLPTGMVAHRVVSLSSGKILLTGDNCPALDPEIDLSSVLGTVIAVERGGKSFPLVQLDRGPRALGRLRLHFKRVVFALRSRLLWN